MTVEGCYLRKKVKLLITYRQLEMLRFNTLKGQYTRLGKLVVDIV